MTDWQPIDTAPRDGTEVELMDEAWGEVWSMKWSLSGGIWVLWGFSGSLLATWSEGDGAPTHWRPLSKAAG